jgi:hypothetical protein
MISSSFNWTHDQADLLRRAARCAPLWGGHQAKPRSMNVVCLLQEAVAWCCAGLNHASRRSRNYVSAKSI